MRIVRPSTRSGAIVSGLTFLLCGALSAPAFGEPPKPGELVARSDADRVRDLVSPGVAWLVSRGMNLQIIPWEPTGESPAYKAATEKYAAQVRLGPDGVLDEDTYVAGRPFPFVTEDDPQAAIKIMYNFERTRYFTDDLTARLFDAETGSIHRSSSGGQTYSIERHFILDSLRILKFTGRTEVPPMPKMPNPDRVLAKAGQFPIIEPFDLKGVGGLSYRYLDPKQHDNTWLYLPSLRRVRRLSTAQRSDALFGQDIDVDSYGGYAGQIPWFDWKLIGAREMLVPHRGEHLPPKPCEEDGGVTFCDNWALSPKVYVVEGKPRLRGYAYSKRVIFVDAHSFYIPYTDMYDHGGELWKTAVIFGRHSTKPNPHADLEYPYPRDFLFGFVMVDIQLEHGTRAAIPGIGFPDQPGWYLHKGEKGGISEEWFTVGNLIAAGR